ncbi:hypothetical protein L1987_54532 [Smallanthus sonchifolius]|uniref:Uncharacterized protein n=1 Tax=Smallanthus sonchifolius TaxID=185202 RepID=A0ACB9E7C7_9ASTR|nr:hypothetical protein L1987_54532 [Smallanthus sonchifolius]
MLNYDNEIGTPQKPPKLLNINDYYNWKARFEHYISYTDSSLWIPIIEGYKHPTHIYLDEEVPKPISKLDEEQKKAYDREKKALGSITMSLTRELFHSFRGYDTSKDLWKALQKRFEGNSDIKKSKRDLLRKQYECFNFMENESLDDLISRFYHLQTELKAFELKYPDEELVEKFLDALPPKFEMYTTLMRENPIFYELTVDEAIGKIQAHNMNLMKKESSGRPQIQDPSMYHGTTSTSKSSGTGITLFTGHSNEEDHSNGCGGHACYASGSGLGTNHQHTSRNPPATSSANHSAIVKIVEDHVALFSSCMLAYENFIGDKLTYPETIEEDFNQVDPDDIEDMDIQWNIAMLLRRAKRFLNRTGRKFIGGHSNAKVGFDKSKAKCYKCLNYGHFARECQKDRAPASGFTRPSQGNSHGHNNTSHHNQHQGGSSNALVAQHDENFDWGVHLEDAIIAQTQVGLMAEIMELMEVEGKEAEEMEASVAVEKESTTAVALMAIGEAHSSSSEVDSNPFSIISCSKCLGLKLEISKLQDKLEPLTMAAHNYKENEKRFKESVETLKKEKCEYSLQISEQQVHLDIAYRGLEKRNNEINKLQNEILQLKCTNEKLKNSSFVVEHYESVVRKLKGLGLGTNAIPPPISGKFVNSLIDIDLTCLDESSDKDDSTKKDESSSKANSTSSEEYVSASDDGSVNTCPEGVVSEELLTEQIVHKNIITNGDNCILTEPDIIETNDKRKVMLYGGYKNINQVKKEAFSAHYGLGYKENLQKYYTPKNQTEKGQTPVHKPTPSAHNGELSKGRSNEPYKRTHVDKRMCFHCGMVGHILVNCPSKNQGKRHVVSQPAVIPKSPIVKPPRSPNQNVVKPPVQPMGKPKIKSEGKPSVARKVKQHAVPHVSTSGSTRTGEKSVARLSKPQRRRRNKRLRKLEQLTKTQSGEASTSSPAVVEPKSTVLVKNQKRSWNKKVKGSQSPVSNSSKDSPISNSHHDYELKEVVYFEKDGRPKTTMAWVSKSN